MWLTVAHSGAYNVAATDMNADPVRWTFETTMQRSVSSRADDIDLPDTVPEEVIAQGASHSAIAAFVSQLPGLSPEDYRTMTSDSGGRGGAAAASQ